MALIFAICSIGICNLLHRNLHSWIRSPFVNPRLPCTHNTIRVRPNGIKAPIFTPNIPTSGIPSLVCFSIYIMSRGWCLILHPNTIGMTDIRIWIYECSCNPKEMVCAFIYRTDCKEVSSIYISRNSKRLGRTISPTTNARYISSKFLAQCPIFLKSISFRRSEP